MAFSMAVVASATWVLVYSPASSLLAAATASASLA